MISKARRGLAWQGWAMHGTAVRPPVRQLGQFSKARLGSARRGRAGRGTARLNACRWAVSPDTFRSNN